MRSIRFVLSILLMFCISGLPVWGKPAGLAALGTQVERQVVQAQTKANAKGNTNAKSNAKAARPAAKQNPAGLTERQQQITAALDKVRLKADDPSLQGRIQTFSEFEAENESLTRQFQYRADLLHELTQPIVSMILDAAAQEKKQGNNSLEEALEKVSTVEQKQPDYGTETKGIPFIYVTDASGHGTQSIVREVNAVMQAVRQANPKARILLATEFGVMLDFSTPIQFAGKTNKEMLITASYDQLVPQANQLGIDILALDDAIVGPLDEEYTWCKIGNRLLFIPLPYEKVMAQEQWEKIGGFVNVSTLGMKLRNEQWVSYIQAVKPFYDIVIVYAGNGHIDSENLPEFDLPILLGDKYSVFNFYTLEQNKDDDEFLTKTHKMLCDTNACVQVPQDPQDAMEYGSAAWQIEQPAEDAPEWDGRSYIYEKTDYQAFRKVEPLLPAQAQKEYKEGLKKFLEAGFKDIYPVSQFEVYLPSVEP